MKKEQYEYITELEHDYFLGRSPFWLTVIAGLIAIGLLLAGCYGLQLLFKL